MTLSNGYKIPSIGFGTWQIPDGEAAVMLVQRALEKGYRHIDTAAIYGNEVSVGQGIKASGVAREDIFVTSKVWNKDRGYEKTLATFEKTLSDLQLEYLDLYLIHWPANSRQFVDWKEINAGTWKALETLYKQGKIKAIGVSNFLTNHLKALLETCEIKPMVNQIEYHPGFMQEETVRFCKNHDILVEGWSPLGTGKVLSNEILRQIADRYDKSVAQICIRWVLQNGVLPLPKSVTPIRIVENIQVFDFEILEEDMKTINEMEYFGGSGLNPEEVEF